LKCSGLAPAFLASSNALKSISVLERALSEDRHFAVSLESLFCRRQLLTSELLCLSLSTHAQIYMDALVLLDFARAAPASRICDVRPPKNKQLGFPARCDR